MDKEACRIKVGVRVRPLMSTGEMNHHASIKHVDCKLNNSILVLWTERESGAQNVIGIDNNDTNRGKVISKVCNIPIMRTRCPR
jgi:hypothetical protein